MTQSNRWLAGEQGPCWVCGVVDGTAKASVVSATADVLVLISPMPLNLLHVIPRFVGDDVRFNAPPQLITRGEQAALAERLRPVFSSA
ncbi:MAG: hypothetical protein HY271_07520 [Deltaproteobacteria bacterium]|nr:hypothetical protein [Deltaproteobacteria bacterium]